MNEFLEYTLKGLRSMLDNIWQGIKNTIKGWLHDIWANKWVKFAFWSISGIFILSFVVYGLIIFNVLGMNTYEEGYRSGKLADYTVSNRIPTLGIVPPGSLFPTGEGYILLGNDSSRNAVLNGKTISPSYFSTDYSEYKVNNKLVSQPVIMHYRELIHTWFLNGKTDIRGIEFSQVALGQFPDSCNKKRSSDWFANDIGTAGGKIVEAAESGSPFTWKTYEIKIHTGGNEFHQFSVTSEDMYQCALIALKTGEDMRISYSNRAIRDPLTQATSFNMLAIEKAQ